jgi:hypothetical protein
MTEKTEAKEFAYFSGLLTGRKNERERIIKALEEQRIRYGTPFINDILEAIGLNK